MRIKRALSAVLAASLATALFGLTATAAADAVSTARGSAFGIQLGGPVPLSAQPTAEASVPGGPESDSDALLEVPADPVVTSATLAVAADAAVESDIEARLQAVIEGQNADAPATWNVRGYAITEDLAAVSGTVTAEVIESESTAACIGGDIVFGSASRVVTLAVAGTAVPLPSPSPNQVVFDQLGIRIVLWETNWDPATGGLTDDSDTVFTNALHVTAPGGIDLVVSHSEATATCAGVMPQPPDPDDEVQPAPPARPVQGEPGFAG